MIVSAHTYAQIAHLPPSGIETMLADDDREVCFVPMLVASGAQEVMAREVDAKEYGLRPQTRREIALFREVRGERGQAEREAMKRRRAGA